ncbi:MAG: TRAP transporter small permease [Burkholderiales bacterium]|nr:MAG: TRAP transporter small permease [Burkholderiales bacterium]
MRLYVRLLELCGLLAGLGFALIAVATAWDVFLRNVLGGGVRGLIDTVEYALFATTFLAAPWVLYKGGHVQVDFAVAALAPSPRRWMQRLGDLIGFAISVVLVVYSVRVMVAAWQQGNLVLKAIVFPEWWVFAVMPFSLLLLAIEFLRRLIARERPSATLEL